MAPFFWDEKESIDESPFELLWTGRPPSLEERSKFQHLETILMTKHITPVARDRTTRDRNAEEIFGSLPINIRAPVEELVGEYYRCVGDTKSVELSIKKLDFAPCHDYKDHPMWEQAVDIVEGMWAYRYRDCRVYTLEDLISLITLDAASGVPWRLIGLKTKEDVLRSAFMYLILSVYIIQTKPPVWSLCPKTEWYHADDLDAGKVRTFIIPPFHLLLWSLMLFKDQNEKTKEYWWSAYGFSPYRGGTNRMARRLHKRSKWFFTYDVKGWDRRLPLMKIIMRLRRDFTPGFLSQIAKWVAKNHVTSFILLPDGRIIRKSLGNNSGSGTTTGDNILGHCYILCLVLLDLFDGDRDQVLDIVACLFGDDNVGSLPAIPDPLRDNAIEIEATFRRVFSLFGLELDPFKLTHELEGHEFLGFQFTKHSGDWIPRYNVGRIAASFCYTIQDMPDDAVISRCWSLMVMSAGSGKETYEKFASAVYWMLQKFRDSKDPIISSYVDVGVPSFEQVMCFYTGREHGFVVPPHNFLEEGGRNCLFYDGGCEKSKENGETRGAKCVQA